ncbi:hypothetical protein KI688_007737 [Linnemannia hyalina]|uniref:Uncharacterized protein n=1 Tax=Linnemannia hyalina TaxID=64524 RepID=A0A9P7XJ70_9FUNG|nr:hypothetical protein KI688_007737 [Linnemannia hyalina]
MWPRCDGLIQIQGEPPLNIAVLEAAKEFDTTGSKFLFDTQKVIRTLHDMLRSRLAGLRLADDISQFKLNLRILKHLLVTKQLLQTTKEIIHEAPSNWDVDGGDYDEAHEVEEELRSSQHMPTTPRRKVQPPKLQTSPGRITRIRSKSAVRNK